MRAPKPLPGDVKVKEVLGVIVWDVPVRLVDVSRTGCLLESNRHMVVGTTGEFRIEFAGQAFSEELRITRCLRLEGSSTIYRLGAEFLRMRLPNVSSLRRAVHAVLGAKENGVFVDATRIISLG
jgi:PilZ domain-containing protein